MSGCPLVGTEINMRTVFKGLAALGDQLAATGTDGYVSPAGIDRRGTRVGT